MSDWRARWRRLGWDDRASAIVEFALVVPLFFAIVWGGINFVRAYHRLDVLTGSLREGARYGATLNPSNSTDQGLIRARVATYAGAFGVSLAPDSVSVSAGSGNEVHVSVVNYPLFDDLAGVGLLYSTTVSRIVIFRSER